MKSVNLSLLFVYILFMICACNDSTDQEQNNVATPPAAAQEEGLKKQTVYGKSEVTIKNATDIPQSFINALKEQDSGSKFTLDAGHLIVDDSAPIAFPQFLEKEKWYQFRSRKESLMYSLEVKRIDYARVAFRFVAFDGPDRLENTVRVAELPPYFYLGAESDVDDRTGVSYMATEYLGTVNQCEYAFRIGEENGKLMARVIKTCEDESKNLGLEDIPTMRLPNQ